jgi:hypothetical protein
MQNSLFFKVRKFRASDFTTNVHETEECMIHLPSIGHTTVEEALAAYDSQFQGGEDILRWLMNTTPRISVIN